jgi:hypothetical protein
LSTIAERGKRERVLVGGLVDADQRRFLVEAARRNDRSLSAELRRALTLYEATQTTWREEQ